MKETDEKDDINLVKHQILAEIDNIIYTIASREVQAKRLLKDSKKILWAQIILLSLLVIGLLELLTEIYSYLAVLCYIICVILLVENYKRVSNNNKIIAIKHILAIKKLSHIENKLFSLGKRINTMQAPDLRRELDELISSAHDINLNAPNIKACDFKTAKKNRDDLLNKLIAKK
ncbi:MAG: hypothetical protein LBS60_10480 [Deltaproteobacteria bacterium]|jgi:Ca2+/Na+ antiporter|nr:hypothetical protein [Deltaproteobacteria bacterium]